MICIYKFYLFKKYTVNMDEPQQHYAKMKAVRPDRSHVIKFLFYEKSRISKSIETESRLAVAED